MDIRTEI